MYVCNDGGKVLPFGAWGLGVWILGPHLLSVVDEVLEIYKKWLNFRIFKFGKMNSLFIFYKFGNHEITLLWVCHGRNFQYKCSYTVGNY